MKFQIEHRTVFTYSDLISETYTEMRLRPVSGHGQFVHSFRLNTEPSGEVMTYIDRFGNDVRHFNVLTPYQRMSVLSVSEVTTATNELLTDPDPAPIDAYDFRAPSRYVQPSASLSALAPPPNAADPRAAAFEVMNAVFTRLTYEPGATNVQTSAEEALALQRGVCQDFAHVMIGVCRGMGLAARYVSGYLYSPTAGMRDDAASHAWVDVLLPGQGWLALDPTHNCAQGADYVRLGVGRDYADVPPTRGTYKGSASETLAVKVNVRAI